MIPTSSLRALGIALVASLALVLVACGGGGNGGGGSDEEAAGKAAGEYVKTIIGLLTGQTNGQQVLNAFAPECRKDVKASDIDAAIAFIRIFAPSALSDAKITDVDLGKLKYEKTADGVLVTPEDASAIRLRVDGKWQNAEEFFASLGGDFDVSSDDVVDEAVLMVKRDGKWLIGDCSELEDFSGSGGTSSGSGTGTASATPRSSRTGPGSSRTDPIKLGQSGKVEGTWELTVLRVNRDAWALVQAASRFNYPPAANERMLLITVRAKNVATAQKPENIDGFSFKLVGSRNELYDWFSDKTDCGTAPQELDADLFPGGQAEGNICFKVPADETGFVLVWEDFFEDELTYFALE